MFMENVCIQVFLECCSGWMEAANSFQNVRDVRIFEIFDEILYVAVTMTMLVN